MPSRTPVFAWRCALLCGLIGTAGCASTAIVRHWQPAAIDVAGMHRIAVVDFRGDHGDDIASALNARLWDNQFYALIDQHEIAPIQHAAYAPSLTDDQLLQRARERGIDGVILGEVREYRCDDEVLRSTDLQLHEHDTPGGHDRGQRHLGLHQQELIHREAAVTIALRLVDARTGEVRASREASHHFRGDLNPGDGSFPSRGEVLDQLTQMCLDEFIALLAPHQTNCEVHLATGSWYTRCGASIRAANRHAIKGDWDAARDGWERVVARHADCDAALYNLALDAARRQQYSQAEELAMQAIRVRHTDCYAKGLEQIRQQRTSHESVERQRNQRLLQASALLYH